MLDLPFLVTVLESPNHWVGREGFQPRAFVIHKPEGNLPGVNDYLMEPETEKSYHFIIAKQGQAFQLVDPVNSAWHAGVVDKPTWKGILQNVNPNYYTIGIALEGYATEVPTLEQLESLREIIAKLALRFGITLNEETVVFHHEIRGDKTCPGNNLQKDEIINNAFAFMEDLIKENTPADQAV